MNMNTHARSSTASPEAPLGARSGPGALGLPRSEPAGRAPVEADPSSQGTLIVGEGIYVKGEIDSCNTLVVEGRVEASLEAALLKVRKGGLFKGKAEVRAAEIVGRFDGELTVDGLLVVEADGHVSGTLRYREIRIAQGGRVSGDIDLLAEEGLRGETARGAAAGKARVVERASVRR